MSLYDRLLRLTEPKIPVHSFMAALGEVERGFATAGDVAAAFTLDAGEQTELTTLQARILSPRESVSMGGGAITLTNVGASFDATATSQTLPFATVETAGISRVLFELRVNKIGSGTQSWQLWNDTDGVEVAVIDDAGAAGLKYLSVLKTFGAPLASGQKRVRLRAKSTTAADDPVFHCAALLIERGSRLSAEELHQVLLLAETGAAYGTVAALKTRLGV